MAVAMVLLGISFYLYCLICWDLETDTKTNQVLQDATKKKDSDIRIRRNSNVDSFQSGMEDIEFPDYYTEPTHEDDLEENNYESLY